MSPVSEVLASLAVPGGADRIRPRFRRRTLLESAGYRYLYEGAEFRVATADSLAVQEGWVFEGTVLQFDLW